MLQVLCHFKMLPWTLHVKVPGGRTLRTEVAPESTMSDLVALVVKQSLNRKVWLWPRCSSKRLFLASLFKHNLINLLLPYSDWANR